MSIDRSFFRAKTAMSEAVDNGATALEVALTGIAVGFDARAAGEDMHDRYAARVAQLKIDLDSANRRNARLAAAVQELLPAALIAGEMLRALGRNNESAVLFRAEATARETLVEVSISERPF